MSMLHTHEDRSGLSLKVFHINPDELNPYKNNSRTHSNAQIQQVVHSIEEFGFTNPVPVDRDKNIIAGHARIAAAKLLGLASVPAIYIDYLTDAQKKAYIIADNRLAEKAGWDMEILKIELEEIINLDSDFKLDLTGFETGEIDMMLLGKSKVDEEPVIPPVSIKAVSKPGDLWKLGKHRLLCADATKAASYDVLMAGAQARMIFTDPPYNVRINGHVCGKGSIKHGEFKMASGEMSPYEFSEFLRNVFENLCLNSMDGSLHYICMDWRHMSELMDAGIVYTELKNLCVWNKTNGGMGSLYRSKHELVFLYKSGTEMHINNIVLGKNGRYRTNVWDYAGVNTFGNQDGLNLHPTVKPVAMIQDAILDASVRKDIILDVFGGSGSTLLAAEKTGRTAYLMELDPKYVDVIIRRYMKETGKDVRHADGTTFEEKERAAYE